jgi:hypothetical protein
MRQSEPVRYYYDYHLPPEDLLTGWEYPDQSVYALLGTLKGLFRAEKSLIARKLNFYLTRDPNELPLSPDIALFKGIELNETAQFELRSWSPQTKLPPPDVVFEFTAHPEWQWRYTLTEKPSLYRDLGVKEFYAYDGLNTWQGENTFLRGWRFEGEQIIGLEPDERGWLWSEELNSFVEGQDKLLLLYDRAGRERLTEFQALEEAEGRRWHKFGVPLEDEDEGDEESDEDEEE